MKYREWAVFRPLYPVNEKLYFVAGNKGKYRKKPKSFFNNKKSLTALFIYHKNGRGERI
jgi:hypothetical protein